LPRLFRRIGILSLALLMIAAIAPMSASARSGRDYTFTVVFQGKSLPPGAREQIEKTGARVLTTVPEVGMLQVTAKASALPSLQKVTGVRYAAPSLTWKLQVASTQKLQETAADKALASPGDLYNQYQWDIKQVTENGASWRLSKGSHKTTVGIIDTGVFANHNDLKANVVGGRNFVPAGANGDATETGDPNDYGDRNGHGSHVAGSIAGNGRIYGVGPNLGVRAYRVFPADGSGQTAWITGAMVQAANDRVDVISMSLGGYDVVGKVTWTDPETGITYDIGDDHADLAAWKRAFEYVSDKNVVVVAAAGNEGVNGADPKAIVASLNELYAADGYHFEGKGVVVPAGLRGAIAVSATGPDKSLASYSNYGKGFVAVAAPGGDFTRYPAGDWFTDMCFSSYMNEGDGSSSYVFMAGTSMAAPKAAAVAALYIDKYRATHRDRPDPEEALGAMRRGLVDLGPKGYDASFGFGMVDAYKMLNARGSDN
jgi:subtilisin family serine protease